MNYAEGRGEGEVDLPDWNSYRWWTREVPDQRRGEPFRRWLKDGKGAGDMNFSWRTAGVTEIVEAPTGFKHHDWIQTIWAVYPNLLKWFNSPSERAYRYGPIIFIKADWAMPEPREEVAHDADA